MRIAIRKYLPLLLLATMTWNVSCKKEDFDSPPSGGQDPNIVVNTTISALKDYYRDTLFDSNGDPNDVVVQITHDWNIAGTVIADDKSGNFYKSVVIDDGTAGISIRIDRSDFFREYPIGRRIFIKLKNLVIGEYGSMIQLGGYIDLTDPTQPEAAPIPFTLIDTYIFPGVSSLPVIPMTVTINQLEADLSLYENRLVKIEGVEFQASDTSDTYAIVATQSYGELYVTDCNTNEIMLRSSSYATFANDPVPNLNGNITAVFTRYTDTPQLVIRDTYDVEMESTRCNGGGTGVLTQISIADCRALYTGSTTNAPPDLKIRGIVTSDYVNANLDPKNMVIQDATAGIVVRFDANYSFPVGTDIEVNISGQELSEFNGLLEVNNVSISNATVVGTGTVTPAVVTIADINANFEAWESTLVKVTGATISGGGSTYNGNHTVTDATGSMTFYVRSAAVFSGQTYPVAPSTITGLLIPFSTTKQLIIRSPADVQ